MPGACPTIERLTAALRDRQPSGDDAELAAHLVECPACQSRLEALAGGSSWLEAKARTHAATNSDSTSLRQVMVALESRAADVHDEAPPAPELDFLQPSDQSGVPGKFGPYEVIAHVASGGMGIVLKARDPALNRIVALKLLSPTLAANSLARARFIREARAAAAVVHEHVVPIYAVDECAGLPYLVMQFIHGRSLAERIRVTGALRLEEILRIGAQTAAGLAAAHAQGLIHRDVKPGNILLENSVERVKLTDFGLARAAEDVTLTRTGELAGTPEFMAPEQAANEPVDHRADLFSFGSVLYAMCTGVSPFQASSVIAAVRKVCDARPRPVHEVNSAVPRWLSDIVAKLMAKAPAERFQSAEEVGELLECRLARVQHGELGALAASSKRRGATACTVRRVLVSAAAVLAVTGLLFFMFKDGRLVNSNSTPSPPHPDLTSKPSPSGLIHNPFVLHTGGGRNLGEFSRIEDAVAAAPPGAVIELCWTGSRNIDPVRLPPRPLTLRAGRGFQPVWNSRDSAPALSASAALTLEGIQFQITSRAQPAPSPNLAPTRPRIPPSGLACLSITNGPLRIAHCTVEVRHGETHQACIVLANVGACHVENTLLFGPAGRAMVWQQRSGENAELVGGTAQLTMTNCIAHAAEAFWLDLRQSPGARLEIARSTFHGVATFCVPPSLAATNVEVDARQNVLHTGAIIIDGRNRASLPLSQWLHWRERENLYKPHEHPKQRYIDGIAIQDGPARLEDWNRWWNQTGANSRVVEITFARGAGRMVRFLPEPDDFQIINLSLVEGPPLERDQWSRFGADTANVGPRPVK